MNTNKTYSWFHPLKPTSLLSYGMLGLGSLVIIGITMVLYRETQNILSDRLKERLIAIVSTASIQYDPNDISEIQGPDSVELPAYQKIVNQLQLLRSNNQNIKYAYIFRATGDPDIFEYVADADSMDPTAIVDLDGDGIFGEEEDALNTPGDEYDVSEIPALRNDALVFPTTDDEPVGDQWGLFLSAYAPIKNGGKTIAIVGIDVEVSDYSELISRTFLPFAVFVIFLIVILAILTQSLIHVWKEQVDSVERLDKQKDELLGLVSHQLATPVSSIKWYLEMMHDGDLGKLNKEQMGHISTMMAIGNSLSDLVGMILDVSRIQLGRIQVEKQELDLKQQFQEILESISHKVNEKQQVLNVSLPSEWPRAFLDRKYTRMTIENLLTNAIKYTPDKGVITLDVTIKDNYLHCKVADTGCGIPAREQGKIFGRMFRASNVSNSIDGNGFGLYVARGAVEAQGGRIGFVSSEGKGTIFTVQLPLS